MTAKKLLSQVVLHWSKWDEHEQYYLETLVPQLMDKPEAGDDKEREIFNALRRYLNDDEWLCLPLLIKETRQSILREIEQERLRQQEEEILKLERRKQQKQSSEFLENVESSAIDGIFDLSVPTHLKDIVIKAAYHRALLNGASVYFQRSIQGGNLQDFDILSESAPKSLKELSQEIKAKYVSDAIERNTGIRLDKEQLQTIIATDKVMKVTARAGSGKTRVLVAKAFYLIKYYDVNPNSILLLAFNKNAARELQDRLKSLLGLESFHTARTFHSLAYQIAKPESELVMSDDDPGADKVGKIIQEILRSLWNGNIAESIYTFFRKEAREYEGLGLHLRGEKFYKFRRSLPQSTLRGDTVRSNGEKFIADYLFEHGIGYKYEPAFKMTSDGIYRPDFGIWVGEGAAKKRFVWEHWAFDPDVSTPSWIDGWSTQDIEQYKLDAVRKRRYWTKKAWVLIETHAGMLSRGRQSFEEEVRSVLLRHGINHSKLPQSKLLNKVEVNLRSRLARLLTQGEKKGSNAKYKDLGEKKGSNAKYKDLTTLSCSL